MTPGGAPRAPAARCPSALLRFCGCATISTTKSRNSPKGKNSTFWAERVSDLPVSLKALDKLKGPPEQQPRCHAGTSAPGAVRWQQVVGRQVGTDTPRRAERGQGGRLSSQQRLPHAGSELGMRAAGKPKEDPKGQCPQPGGELSSEDASQALQGRPEKRSVT